MTKMAAGRVRLAMLHTVLAYGIIAYANADHGALAMDVDLWKLLQDSGLASAEPQVGTCHTIEREMLILF